MKTALLLAVFVGGCALAPVLSVQDRAGLGAYLAFKVVGNPDETPVPAPAPRPPDTNSEVCPECNGRGKQGDGTIDFPCNACNGTGRVPKTAPDDPPVERVSQKPKITGSSGPRWNVNGKWNYTTVELADHLRREHGVNINGKTRAELEAIHDGLHNGQITVQAAPRSTKQCPGGNCPLR